MIGGLHRTVSVIFDSFDFDLPATHFADRLTGREWTSQGRGEEKQADASDYLSR